MKLREKERGLNASLKIDDDTFLLRPIFVMDRAFEVVSTLDNLFTLLSTFMHPVENIKI